ncbi:hypothetical protein KBD45_06935 [Candidatus Dojkabacteria bacterium]|nr:hypothetical protein [Candidatus Dojkabacteria bacterium]
MSKLCPYCFENFEIEKTQFRCANHVSRCTHVPDDVLINLWHDHKARGKVLNGQTCPECKQETHKRLCPKCHQELPSSFSDSGHQNYVFAVIGAKGTGKSHYIATFIEYIKNHVGLVLNGANDETINRYNNNFKNPVFKEHRLLSANDSGVADVEVRKPMIFTLSFDKKNLFGKIDKNRKSVFYISLFDTAGEDLDDQDTMSFVNKYIYRADGILLLVDPLQLDTVRDLLKTKTPNIHLPQQHTETETIITRVSNLIRAGRKLTVEQVIPIPFAVALSKLDTVIPIIDNQSHVLRPSASGKTFNLPDFEAVNAEIQGLITEWASQFLINQVSAGFSQYGFFGLSALGSTPSDDGRISAVLPKRIADPFLWLLHKNGMIKAT